MALPRQGNECVGEDLIFVVVDNGVCEDSIPAAWGLEAVLEYDSLVCCSFDCTIACGAVFRQSRSSTGEHCGQRFIDEFNACHSGVTSKFSGYLAEHADSEARSVRRQELNVGGPMSRIIETILT